MAISMIYKYLNDYSMKLWKMIYVRPENGKIYFQEKIIHQDDLLTLVLERILL